MPMAAATAAETETLRKVRDLEAAGGGGGGTGGGWSEAIRVSAGGEGEEKDLTAGVVLLLLSRGRRRDLTARDIGGFFVPSLSVSPFSF